MLTDEDIQRLKEVFATKEDLEAIRQSIRDILETLVLHDRHLESNDKEITELLSHMPGKADIHHTFDLATLAGDLERIKHILREKLNVETETGTR